MDGEDERSVFDREAFVGVDEFLAPVSSSHQYRSPEERGRRERRDALLTLVLIPPHKFITLNQIPQRVVHAVGTVEVERKVEHVVERVGIVTASGGDARTETTAEELVEGGEGGGGGGEFAVRFGVGVGE